MNTAEIFKPTESDLYSKNVKSGDIDLFNVVKQVCELTGCSHDAAATALFDCNYDIERAVNKIFEHPSPTIGEKDAITSAWKEVAKQKKKGVAAEVAIAEPIVNVVEENNCDYKVDGGAVMVDNNRTRGTRGSARGQARNARGSGRIYDSNNEMGQRNLYGRPCDNGDLGQRNTMRLRGRRPNGRGISNRGRPRQQYGQDASQFDLTVDGDVDDEEGRHVPTINEWLSDDGELETIIDAVTPANVTSVVNPVEIVAKYSCKDGVFGDFSRTKAPTPSTVVPTEAVRLMTSTGVMSLPSRTGFHFGLDFAEYCGAGKSATRVSDEVRMGNAGVDDHRKAQINQDGISRVHGVHIDDKVTKRPEDRLSDRIHSADNSIRKVLESLPKTAQVEESGPRRSKDSYESPSHSGDHSVTERAFKAAPQCLNENTFTTVLPSSPQLCPPPGMSNAHILQQLQSNPQQYLSLMNLPGGPSIYDMADIAASSANVDSQPLHPSDSKDFLAQTHTSKTSEHDNAAVLNAYISCYPQLYMNNYASYIPAVAGHNTTGQNADPSQPSKPLYALSTQRNYASQEEFVDTGKFEDVSGKHSYARGQNYSAGYKEDDKTKMSRQSLGNRGSMPNDPRFLAFSHSSHAYPGNMYNCVTAPGPSVQHPYAMSHQTSGMSQMHPQLLMQQQMHNFPQPYQFQEHIMSSMVPGANNRSGNSGSNGSQARNSRSNSALWQPTN